MKKILFPIFNMKSTAFCFISLFTFHFSLFTSLCNAQYKVLLDFNGKNGELPQYGSLLLSGNVLYGMTYVGGKNDYGLIFSVDTNGDRPKDLWDFDDTGTNGAWPYGSLILSGKVLYGMTSYGGTVGANFDNDGLIFAIDTTGSGYSDLWNFDGTDGEEPEGSLIFLGNVLFGTTQEGGTDGWGNVFSMNMNGTGFNSFFSCTGGSNGENPGSLLLASGDVFYGTTYNGGTSSDGCIFSINSNGKWYKDIFNFIGANGNNPGDLIISGKVLFGMTNDGGVNSLGNIFSVDTNGDNFKNLLNFNGTNGSYPGGSLLLSDSVLYGMTEQGGAYTHGCIFRIDTMGKGYKDLFDFNSTSGENPGGTLIISGNALYGTTEEGGNNGDGVVFKFTDNSLLGIDNIASAYAATKVYPNPNNGILTIQFIGVNPDVLLNNQWSLEVFNELGERVYSQFNIQHSTFNIDMSNQPDGVYLYRVIAGNGSSIGNGKIVVQKNGQ